VCDITRPVPNKILLPPLLELLEASGISRDAITILVGTGLHRESSLPELFEMLGESILGSYRVASHDARDPLSHHYCGVTRRGTPVFVDRRYWEADLKITVGFIEPHFMAGFSGGRKLVAIGCASEQTIKALHSPLFLEDPCCREGEIDRNPLHHELLEIANMAGHDFVIDVSLDPSRFITGIFAGAPETAHTEGVRSVRRAVSASLQAPADIVVTTGGGYPLDLTLYQAVKGLTGALPAVKKGGTLILGAECREGLGGPEFTRLATSHTDLDAFMKEILASPVEVDQWQLEEYAKASRHATVILVSEPISRMHPSGLFIRAAGTVQEVLREGIQWYGENATVAVIPEGPYTLVGVP
jgi:nickel-dependent lactate racemase